MSISGPVVHQQLMHAYATLQSNIESARGRVSQVSNERVSLDDNRSESLVRLAEHYLPELTPDAVRETWQEVRPSVSQILSRQQAHASRVHQRLDKLIATRQQSDRDLVELNARIDQATEKQQEVADQVEQEIREDSKFAELADRAAVAEAALERAEANQKEIEGDAEKKLPAYKAEFAFHLPARSRLRDR